MSAFLITVAVWQLIKVGVLVSRKPGTTTVTWSAGELVFATLLSASIAGWAIYLLLAGSAR